MTVRVKREVLAMPPKIAVSCVFDTVTIHIHCGDDYEAQTLFDDISARFKAGESVIIDPAKANSK